MRLLWDCLVYQTDSLGSSSPIESRGGVIVHRRDGTIDVKRSRRADGVLTQSQPDIERFVAS